MSNQFLEQYVKDCLRTESKLDKLELNEEVVNKLFEMFIELTEILDGVKKSTFYGKDEKLINEFYNRLNRINLISGALISKTKADVLHKDSTDLNPRVFHGILGIMTEAGELAEIWKDYAVNGKHIDPIHIQEELGDGMALGWYPAILHDELGLDPAETLNKNIRKLKVRYPHKYNNLLSEQRKLKEERKALEE